MTHSSAIVPITSAPSHAESVLRPLSKYTPPVGGALLPDISTIESLATISAGDLKDTGKKNAKGEPIFAPVPNRDGKISLHDPEGRAPGLKAVLQERKYKSLIIGFGQNDPADFIRQRHVLYSRGSLKIVGDETGLTEWDENGDRHELEPDTAAFNTAWQKCSDETWVYFYLAAVDADGPMLVCPDGLWVPYRLRFTSINSRRALDSLLRTLRDVGQFAIMPILLQLDGKRPVVLPPAAARANHGNNRGTAPVWSFSLMATSGTVRLNSRRLLEVRDQARTQSDALALSPPSDAVVRQALMSEGRSTGDDLSDEAVLLMARGGVCDSERWRRIWFAAAKGTAAEPEQARHRFIQWYTKRTPDAWQTDSLAEFLAHATDADAALLVDAMLTLVEGQRARGEETDADGAVRTEQAVASTPAAPPSETSENLGEDAGEHGWVGDGPLPEDGGENTDDVSLEALAKSLDDTTPADETPDDADVANAWVSALSERYTHFPTDEVPKKREQNTLGRLLLAATDNDTSAATHLLHAFTGAESLANTTLGQVRVLLVEGESTEWRSKVEVLKRVIGIAD